MKFSAYFAHIALSTFFVLPISASDVLVTNNLDNGSNGSLRQVITNASAGSRICFDSALSGQTIRLLNGALGIDKNVTIDASNLQDGIVISGDRTGDNLYGADDSRVFVISAGRSVTLKCLTINHGKAADGSPGDNGEQGGGIINYGNLTLVRCTVSHNRAGNGGDGVTYDERGGDGGAGGGIFNDGGTLTLEQCTVTGNHAGSGGHGGPGGEGGDGAGGGGILNDGALTLVQCTVTLNQAGEGGNGGVRASVAGAIHGDGGDGGVGGGIRRGGDSYMLSLTDSLVANNSAGGFGGGGNAGSSGQGPDLDSDYQTTRFGINLIGNNSLFDGTESTAFPSPAVPGDPNASGDLVGTAAAPINPLLALLGDNGGPTWTHLPRRGSPAIDPVNAADTSGVPIDQRGSTRIINGAMDIGAVEAPFYPAIDAAAAALAAARTAERSAILRKLKKLKRKFKKSRQSGSSGKGKKLKKQIRKAKSRLLLL